MPIADDARSLTERILSDLVRAAEYYLNSVRAWRLIQELVEEGRHFEVFDRDAEKRADQQSIGQLSQQYVTVDLARATLDRLLAVLENFLVSLHRLWLQYYPEILDKKTISLREIRSLPDKAAVVNRFIESELRDFAYKKPADWFLEFEANAKLGCPLPGEIARVAEAKARRDIVVHNRGVVNWTYTQKAGDLAAYREGETVEVPANYLADAIALVKKSFRTCRKVSSKNIHAHSILLLDLPRL